MAHYQLRHIRGTAALAALGSSGNQHAGSTLQAVLLRRCAAAALCCRGVPHPCTPTPPAVDTSPQMAARGAVCLT